MGTKPLGKLPPLLRPLAEAVQGQACAPPAIQPHALRVVNDGAVGSCTGDGGEAQVHKVSLLPGTETAGSLKALMELGTIPLAKKSALRSKVFTSTYLRNSSALSAAEISVTPPLGTYKKNVLMNLH